MAISVVEIQEAARGLFASQASFKYWSPKHTYSGLVLDSLTLHTWVSLLRFLLPSGPQDLDVFRGHWKDGGRPGGLHHLHLQRHRPGQPQLHVHGGGEPGHGQGESVWCF